MLIEGKKRQDDFARLRHDFPVFTYHGFKIGSDDEGLTIRYHFSIEGLAEFRPSWSFPGLREPGDENLLHVLSLLAFNLGLVESVSYWKSTCSPVINVPASLPPAAITWWRKLFFRGLGEFRYLNGIDTGEADFINMVCHGEPLPPAVSVESDPGRVIIPVGGGKDSVVTMELLSRAGYVCTPYMVNPTEASLQGARLVDGLERPVIAKRRLDKALLSLNDDGFLNGHTPFSAIIAFSSAIVAALRGTKYIALSNEASANEDTIPGTGINHQYSKSYEFEKDFSDYLSAYITPSLSYFSFLRPLSELSIAGLFAGFPAHLPVFRSCNIGSRSGEWCGNCPKCLFAFIILLPFVPYVTLKEVFGKDLLSDPSLLPWLRELSGLSHAKPFECVGTISEVRQALLHFAKGHKLPPLLEPIAAELGQWHEVPVADDLRSLHGPHSVPAEMLKHLVNAQQTVTCTGMDR